MFSMEAPGSQEVLMVQYRGSVLNLQRTLKKPLYNVRQPANAPMAFCHATIILWEV